MSPYRGGPPPEDPTSDFHGEKPMRWYDWLVSGAMAASFLAIHVWMFIDTWQFAVFSIATYALTAAIIFVVARFIGPWRKRRTARLVAEALHAMDREDAPRVRVESVLEEEEAASLELHESAVLRVQK